MRRLGDVLMRRCCYVLLRRCHDVSIRRHGDMPLRRRWLFYLRRTCCHGDIQRDVATTSPRRLVAGWAVSKCTRRGGSWTERKTITSKEKLWNNELMFTKWEESETTTKVPLLRTVSNLQKRNGKSKVTYVFILVTWWQNAM